jgi:hypothetical protein
VLEIVKGREGLLADISLRGEAAATLEIIGYRMAAWQCNYGPIQLADLRAVGPAIDDALVTEQSPWVQHTLKWAKQTIAVEE